MGSGSNRNAQGHSNSSMMRTNPATDEIGEGSNISGRYGMRCIRRKAERSAGALRKFITVVTAIEEIEPCRPTQRRDGLAWKNCECGAADQQCQGVGRRHCVFFGSRSQNIIELRECRAAVPIGMPPSRE